MSHWTTTQIAELRRRRASGVSLKTLAAERNVTRQAISFILCRDTPRKEPAVSQLDRSLVAELWAQGYSQAVIGKRLGVSKNIISGLVYRAGLPHRPTRVSQRSNAA